MSDIILPSIICSLGWGLAPIFEKRAMFYLPPVIAVAIFGLFFGFFGLLIFAYLFAFKKPLINKNLKDLKIGGFNIFIAAFLAYIIGTLFFFIALGTSKLTSAVILITYTLPILIGILATIFVLKEKVNYMMWLGIIITLLGLVITVKYK